MRTLLLLALVGLVGGSAGFMLGQRVTHVERIYSDFSQAEMPGYTITAKAYMDVCKPGISR